MNVLTTIKKIIFGIFLCFVFLGFAPVHVFAGDTSAYTGFNNVYRATNVVTVHTANEDGDVTYTVNLSSDTSENFTPCELFENFTVDDILSLIHDNVCVYEKIISKIKNMCDIS